METLKNLAAGFVATAVVVSVGTCIFWCAMSFSWVGWGLISLTALAILWLIGKALREDF